MKSPQISVYIATSIDGYIAREDGAIDWLTSLPSIDGEDYGYASFMDTVDTIVMGRNTYDMVLNFDGWPFEGKKVVVVTNRPLTSKFGESSFSGPLKTLFADLGKQNTQRVYLDGGQLISQALEADLVDDMTLSTIPVLLGSGRPLFHKGFKELSWKLLASTAYPVGLLQSRYARQR